MYKTRNNKILKFSKRQNSTEKQHPNYVEKQKVADQYNTTLGLTGNKNKSVQNQLLNQWSTFTMCTMQISNLLSSPFQCKSIIDIVSLPFLYASTYWRNLYAADDWSVAVNWFCTDYSNKSVISRVQIPSIGGSIQKWSIN